jgi:hypothetical protein
MTKALMSKVNVAALEGSLESALMPGTYLVWRAKGSFMDKLRVVEHDVELLAKADAAAGASRLRELHRRHQREDGRVRR